MAQQHIDFGTPPTGSDGDTVVTALQKMEDNFTELYGITGDLSIDPGYITGFKMNWVSSSALTLGNGSAYIPSSGDVLRASSPIAKTGLSLSASTLYYCYVFDNAGTPDFELSTTAPDAAYSGTARTKNGDTSRRYVGSVVTGSGGSIIQFEHHAQTGRVLFLVNIGAGSFKILNAGTATSDTNVSVASLVPLTARLALIEFENTNAAGTVLISVPGGTGNTIAFVRASGITTAEAPLLSARAVSYYTQSGAAASIYLRGYIDER